jgi:2-amino-4-hydroxy-6-hydroxymethyldihydropteridine diphosphokinase
VDHIRRVVVGLGSNLGDRVDNIRRSVELLRADSELHVTEVSPFYETAAEDGAGPTPFVNGAVLVLTALDAVELLRRLQDIERQLGRVRSNTGKTPRPIDLDILWIEGETIRQPELVVPHERLASRAFMLKPLLDVASDAKDAESGLVFSELPLASTQLKQID